MTTKYTYLPTYLPTYPHWITLDLSIPFLTVMFTVASKKLYLCLPLLQLL